MARLPETNVPTFIELNGRALHEHAQASLGADAVQGRQGPQRSFQVLKVVRDVTREISKNSVDFTGYLTLGDFDPIIQINQFPRFHEHRRPAGRYVMNDPLEVVPTFCLNRQDVSVFVLREVRFLQQLPMPR